MFCASFLLIVVVWSMMEGITVEHAYQLQLELIVNLKRTLEIWLHTLILVLSKANSPVTIYGLLKEGELIREIPFGDG